MKNTTQNTTRIAGAAALTAALAFGFVATTEAGTKRAMGDSGVTGTHAEEYRANTRAQDAGAVGAGGTPVRPGVPSQPNNTTSTGRELTGPGAQPEEYKASGSKPAARFDTVHNVRVQPDTTTATGRAWRDSVNRAKGTR